MCSCISPCSVVYGSSLNNDSIFQVILYNHLKEYREILNLLGHSDRAGSDYLRLLRSNQVADLLS